MTDAAWVLYAVAGAFAALDWMAVEEGAKPLEYVCKPATIVALLAAILLLHPRHEARRDLFAAALGFSLLGDVFLMVPGDRFVAGLASFFAAHVLLIAGILAGGVTGGGVALAALVVVAVGVGIGRTIVAAVEARERQLVPPVVAYIVVISAMVACAAGARPALIGFAAALFYLSDALIAWRRFVRPLRWAPVTIIATYHLAQAGFVLSVAR